MSSKISYFHSRAKNQLERQLYSLFLNYIDACHIIISKKAIRKFIDSLVSCYLNQKNLHHFLEESQVKELKSSPRFNRFLMIVFRLIEEIRRYETVEPRIEFDDPNSIYQYFYYLRTFDQEMMKAVYFKNYRYLKTRDLFLGGSNSILMTPKEVLVPAIKIDADQMILVHNHPSGQLVPSDEDFAFTRKIELLAEKFEIEFIDHLIIGNGYFSFKKEGLL